MTEIMFIYKKHAVKMERDRFLEKCLRIRGVSRNELIWVLKNEFNGLSEEDKKQFVEP